MKTDCKSLHLWFGRAALILATGLLAGLAGMGAAQASPVVVQPGGAAGYMFMPASGGAVDTSSWRPPVVNHAALPACDANSQGHVRLVLTPTVGVGPRAHACSGTVWAALAVDDSGNLAVPGTVTANQVTANQLAGNLQVTTVATTGSACSPVGRIARDADGLILSCQGGAWRRAQGGTGMRGVFAPLAGMTIACSWSDWNETSGVVYAHVNANGDPFIRKDAWTAFPSWLSHSSPWIPGRSLQTHTFSAHLHAIFRRRTPPCTWDIISGLSCSVVDDHNVVHTPCGPAQWPLQ